MDSGRLGARDGGGAVLHGPGGAGVVIIRYTTPA
jgi:hypothetical protein